MDFSKSGERVISLEKWGSASHRVLPVTALAVVIQGSPSDAHWSVLHAELVVGRWPTSLDAAAAATGSRQSNAAWLSAWRLQSSDTWTPDLHGYYTAHEHVFWQLAPSSKAFTVNYTVVPKCGSGSDRNPAIFFTNSAKIRLWL